MIGCLTVLALVENGSVDEMLSALVVVGSLFVTLGAARFIRRKIHESRISKLSHDNLPRIATSDKECRIYLSQLLHNDNQQEKE